MPRAVGGRGKQVTLAICFHIRISSLIGTCPESLEPIDDTEPRRWAMA